jgi:hypothetical protein
MAARQKDASREALSYSRSHRQPYPDWAGAIQLQNAELFGRFFEGLPTGGDARNKRLARLAL